MTSNQFASRFEPNPAAKTDAQREAILANPGFGNHFTDHMFLAEWTPDTDWANARVVPYGPLSIDPATDDQFVVSIDGEVAATGTGRAGSGCISRSVTR